MNRLLLPLMLLLSATGQSVADTEKPILLQRPTLSRTQVAFAYAGDLWIVSRQGGDARRLTSGVGLETEPIFSPDGTQIAFTGEYDGNLDVYVIPATGGEPRRLTYHPDRDMAVGWTPDGKNVLFCSTRHSYAPRFGRLFTMPVEGGFPKELPLPMAEEGSFSPDGSRLAYVPFSNGRFRPTSPFQTAWKRYRGGTASPIWIADLADSHIEKVPRDKSNDCNPMWIGNKVYFLSDRNGPFTLFLYDPATKEVSLVLENKGLDIKSASAGPDAIVYEQFGALHLFDLNAGKTQPLSIRVAGDLVSIRPHFEKVGKKIQNAGLSPTGKRAVFEARGEILTVPAEKGDIRNLTNTPGVCERDPAWSPDGKQIAYLSDESGEYQLHICSQDGKGEVRKISLGDAPSFYFSPTWSPDGKKIVYTDKRLNVWYLDVAKGVSTKVDTNPFADANFDPAWSPDSRWLAYTKELKNHLHAVFVYSLETGKHHQVTDGMSEASSAAFDKNGKYLYFAASTDIGPSLGSEMSGINRPVTRHVYVVVLSQDEPSPLAPESDEEKAEGAPKKADTVAADKVKEKSKQDPSAVRIDLEGIDQRILTLPVPAHNYQGLLAGKAGTLFLIEGPAVRSEGGPPPLTVHKFDLEKRKADKFIDGVSRVVVSQDGEKILYQQGETWFLVGTAQPPQPGQGKLHTEGMEVRVDPRAEWKQMYHEVWRIERDFLYDPNFHGLNLKAAEKKYEPYLESLGHRQDLNYLFEEMLGELTLGHVFVGGGDLPEVKPVKGGLLGADYRVENGRYRFHHIYQGENWDPRLRAPLTQPGARVKEGEYLLAVNGRDLRAADNLFSFFEGTAGRSTLLKVGPTADGKGAREVTVVPLETEEPLRNRAWIEANRRKVDQMTGGRVAYIYLPDTHMGGFAYFNRYFFAQVDKEAAVIDERFNGGGLLADHVIDYLRRPLLSYISFREGGDMTAPQEGIFGPKVMIINEMAGSGGDAMPFFFRQMNLGQLIGKRTWGGLVGIGDYPPLMDGGRVTAPNAGFWFASGEWEVENRGVAPDIEVEHDPQLVRAGHDPQLERAVAVVLEDLKKYPQTKPRRPAYPNYHRAEQAKQEQRDGTTPRAKR
jgi:tricorn protease